ncbi:MAG TPA: hypothetical protein VFU22_31660 [Roseiflexaceae bacterium]|nr:hypothetical protein [Roseiflexaceae bacterium]
MPAAARMTDFWIVSQPFTFASAGGTANLFEITPGLEVVEVVLVIDTPFSGGTPSIDIGDADDPDGWIDTLDVTEGTAGSYRGSAANSPYSISGRYYAAKKHITATLSAALVAGEGRVLARCVDLAS